MINVYPSKLPGEPLERYRLSSPMSLLAWLKQQVKGFDFALAQRNLSIYVNDQPLAATAWDCLINPQDEVAIYPEPKGDPAITAAVIKVAIAVAVQVAVSIIFAAKLPKTSKTAAAGQELYEASATGNKIRYGEPIPEIAGTQERFPDYLKPPRRYFASEREQWLDSVLCIGKGEFEIQAGNLWIGNTPIVSMGDSVSYQIYPPGADLSEDPRAQWWQPSDEVGATAGATAGLPLQRTSLVQTQPDAQSYIFSGFELSIPEGAGAYPDGWAAGMIVRIETQRAFTVLEGDTDRDMIQGPAEAFSELAPVVGMQIEIAGANAGQYQIHSYTPYAAAIPGAAGSPSLLTAAAAPSRYDYNLTPATLSINWGGSITNINLTTDLVNLSGLLAALNAGLPSGLIATDYGGRVRIVEPISPYTGQSLSAGGAVSDVLGGASTGTTGTATTAGTPEQPAQITLNYTDGSPVLNLNTGEQAMSLGYLGLRYRITSADSNTLNLERLTDTGGTDSAWSGFSSRTDTSAVLILDPGSSEADWVGPLAGCPKGEKTTRLEFDIFFPGGLAWLRTSGSLTGHSIEIEWQWRDYDTAGAWTSVIEKFTAATRDAIGYTRTIELPYPMRPEMRMRHLSKWYNHTQAIEAVQWYGLRCLLSGKTSYPGATVLAISVRGGERLSAQTENQIRLKVTRKLPRRIAGAWSNVPSLSLDFANQLYEVNLSDNETTRSIIDWYAYVAKSIGYSDADLDWERLDAYAELFAARGDCFDYSYTSTSTVRDVLTDCLRVGFADLTVRHGLLSMARDEPRTLFEQGYSPQNNSMDTALVRSCSMPKPTDFDGVDLEYLDADTWTTETIECRLPGDEGKRVEKITAEGITSRLHAYRFGMRRRCELRYRTKSYTWRTELDAFNSEYLSYCPVSDDVPGYGQSAILEACSNTSEGVLLRSSEAFDWSAEGEYVVGIRKPDGVLDGPYPVQRLDDYHLLIPDIELDWTPDFSLAHEPPHLMFGLIQTWSYPVLITEINPDGFSAVDCTAVGYDARVYQYDDAPLPAD